jgi:hypothetical protein
MAVNGVTGVDGSANSPLVGGGLVMIQNGCGELPNGKDQRLAPRGLSTPLSFIASPLHRLVRHSGGIEPTINHLICNDNESLAHPYGQACDRERRNDRPRPVRRQILQIDAH